MADEHEGMGGSYVLDKKTGKRKLVERTAPGDGSVPATPEPPAPEPTE